MSVLREVEAVRTAAGCWQRDDFTVLQFTGRDAGTWLQTQTTNDVAKLESGQGQWSALLDRQGRVRAFFTLHRFEDEYWIVIEREQLPRIQERIDSHLILEDVQMEEVGADTPQICVEGPRALPMLATLAEGETDAVAALLPNAPLSFAPLHLFGHDVLVFDHSESGEVGFLLVPAPGESDDLFAALLEHGHDFGVESVSEPARETLQIESGYLRHGRDIDARRIIAETPLERMGVSYSKGCYLGQEVVARLKTYGSPKLALVGLVAQDDARPFPAAGTALSAGGKRCGEMGVSQFSPTLGHWIGLAYLDRNHRTPGTAYEFSDPDGAAHVVTVSPLPLYEAPDRQTVARRLYDEALRLSEADAGDTDERPIDLLKVALLLAPDFEDAYEMIGVILHRHHRLDEAIGYMKRLATLNPNCVMAHTNLSIFYVAQGRIDDAENEKAIAAQLEFKRQLDERDAAKQAQAERERIRREAEERIGMFKEVLEIDPEDPVATMGLGSAYIQLDQHADAIPYLITATQAQKDYSAAYLNLGKCLEVTGDMEQAIQAYKAGIEVASRKGDLMPLREMERRLNGLTHESVK